MTEPAKSPDQSGGISRKRFLQAGAAAAGSLYLGGMAASAASAATSSANTDSSHFHDKNLVIFMTDQERPLMWFPPGWMEEHLPGLTQLTKSGITFTNAITNACACSPARSTLMTGLYPAQHGVKYVLEHTMYGPNYPQVDLLPRMPTIAKTMTERGYYTVYKGKWHCSKYPPADTTDWILEPTRQYPNGSPYNTVPNPAVYPNYTDPLDMLEPFGWHRWNAPDSGANQAIEQMGGGIAQHDARAISSRGDVATGDEGVLQFIRDWPTISQNMIDAPGSPYSKANPPKFCLFISLVNPHDVLAYPRRYAAGGYTRQWLEGDIGLPPTYGESLKTKPKAQAIYRELVALGTGALPNTRTAINYLNFYGNLMKASDDYLANVLAALRAVDYDPTSKPHGLLGDTLVIRTADHGEMGLTHGGQRQKWFQMYEETIRIPLIYSNPIIWPKGQKCDQMVSHVDLLPTLASLMGDPVAPATTRGVDYSRLVRNPKGKAVQSYLVFQNEDFQSGFNQMLVPPPQRILGIREKDWKLAKYYAIAPQEGTPEYEMYDLKYDKLEVKNLTHPSNIKKMTDRQKRAFARLKAKLNEIEQTTLQPLPGNLTPTVPMPVDPEFGSIKSTITGGGS